jgi:hypothetical protein
MSHGVMCIVVVKSLSHQMPCRVTGWVLHVTRCHVHGESPIYRMPSRVMGIWINVTWCHVHWYLSKSRHTECRLRSQGGCCMSHGVMCMIVLYTGCHQGSWSIWSNVTWCHVHFDLSKSGHTECRLRSQGGCCMSHGVMCMMMVLYTECHQGSQDIWSNVACVHATPKISNTPNAVSGHREYGLQCYSNPIQAAIMGSESRCAAAGSHGVSVPSVHAVDASIYVPVMIPFVG